MKVGKANYSGQKKNFKIKDGDNVYRILPPLGNMADSGQWKQYYRVCWGFKDSDGINRPFLDPRVKNYQTQMIEVESPSHLFREGIKANKELIAEQFKKGEATREQLTEAVDLCKRYNLEAKYYLNVVNLQGEIGLLKIGTRAKQGLDAAIKKLTERGIDPLSLDDGRYFNFFRTGKGLETIYTVTTYAENIQAVINGQDTVVQQEKVHAMDEAFISRLGNEAFELSGMYKEVTPEQEQRFLDEGIPAIEEILGRAKDKNAEKAAEKKEEEKAVTPPVEQPVAEKKVEKRAEAVADTSITQKTEAVATPDIEQKPATETTAKTVVAEKEVPPANPDAMSDADFLASIGC